MEIQISVRAFVEFLMRSGDIDNRRSVGSEDAMAEGARIHRMIQRRMGGEYHSEVSLSHTVQLADYAIVIEGRADGIIDRQNGDMVVVDEIKTTYRELKRIKAPEPVHLAQAQCYAYIYALQNELSQIGVRMTYCNIETEEIKYFHENYTFSQLEKWFLHMIDLYRKWSDFEYEWKIKRRESIRELSFPFEYRTGQKQLVGYVYQTINEHKKLFIEAPTGVGKTISTIYPSVKAVGEGKAEKIFYLTAKTITGSVARETFSLLREQGFCFKKVTVTAKEKMCPLEECACNPVSCPYAKGHYDRINDAVYDLLTKEDEFDRETILEYALQHEVCPFEMCLDMSLFSDGIICDYNYLFDPYAYLRRFFADGLGGLYLFLIDEAHNLVERGRNMYSAVLVKEDFLRFCADVKEISPYIARLSEKCNKEMLALKKECEHYRVLSGCAKFINACNKLHGVIHQYLEDHDESPIRQILLDFYFEIGHFLDTYDRMNEEHYVTYTGYDEEDCFFIKEFCVDPSEELKKCMDKGVASVLFSATFLPIQYYKNLLGGEDCDYEVYAKSTFSPERQIQLIGREVTSKYTRRNEAEYENIARYIHAVIDAKDGNYMVFFPSHAFLEQVYEAFMNLYGQEEHVRILRQKSRMSEAEREDFLKFFSYSEAPDFEGKINMEIAFEEVPEKSAGNGENSSFFDQIYMRIENENDDMGDGKVQIVEKTLSYENTELNFSGHITDCEPFLEDASKVLLGFCVQGGIFSEGIDLKHDSLIGVIIVGTGLPQVGPEREILKQHFDSMGQDGFDYAYKYPGMNKVLQAAGRVIRTKDDAGIIALLDERFLQAGYKKMFPAEWKHVKSVGISEMYLYAKNFWEEL